MDSLAARIASCVDDVNRWLSAKSLQLNVGKTVLLWCSTTRDIDRLPNTRCHSVEVSTSVRDIGIFLDADLSMRRYTDVAVARCFAVLRQLRPLHQHVFSSVFQTLTTTLLLTRQDYGNAVLYGLWRFCYVHYDLFRKQQQSSSLVCIAPII